MPQALPTDGAAESGVPFRGLDALLGSAVQASPNTILLRDDAGTFTTREFAARVQRLARSYRQCGLTPGERVLLVVGATTESMAALFAALRAGLEPALAPCGLGPVELAAYARAADAVALIGPTHYGPLALGDAYLSAAALSEGIRLVATLGPQAVDGAADLSLATPDLVAAVDRSEALGAEGAIIVTFEGPAATPAPLSHRQTALFAAALSLIDQARLNPMQPILSTLLPASLAGLVAGPYAALIANTSLAMHGPFDASGFLALYDAAPGTALVAPAEIGAMLRGAGMGVGTAPLILLSRFASPTGFILPPGLVVDRPLVDLYAFGETAVLARRRVGSIAQTPPELSDGSLPGRLGVALNRARSESRTLGAAGG